MKAKREAPRRAMSAHFARMAVTGWFPHSKEAPRTANEQPKSLKPTLDRQKSFAKLVSCAHWNFLPPYNSPIASAATSPEIAYSKPAEKTLAFSVWALTWPSPVKGGGFGSGVPKYCPLFAPPLAATAGNRLRFPAYPAWLQSANCCGLTCD